MLTYLLPLPLLPYFPITYLLSLYVLCSRWRPKRGRGGTESDPKAAINEIRVGRYGHFRSEWTSLTD